MQCGSTFGLISAIEILRIYWPNEESSSVGNRFDCGVISLDLDMLRDCVESIGDLGIHSISMKFSSELAGYSIIFGGQ